MGIVESIDRMKNKGYYVYMNRYSYVLRETFRKYKFWARNFRKCEFYEYTIGMTYIEM